MDTLIHTGVLFGWNLTTTQAQKTNVDGSLTLIQLLKEHTATTHHSHFWLYADIENPLTKMWRQLDKPITNQLATDIQKTRKL